VTKSESAAQDKVADRPSKIVPTLTLKVLILGGTRTQADPLHSVKLVQVAIEEEVAMVTPLCKSPKEVTPGPIG